MSRKYTPLNHSIPSAFVFLLIGLFAVTSLTLTLIGTRVYRSVAGAAARISDSQMVLSYLCNKIRTFDAQGNITLDDRGGTPVLSLTEDVDGEPYETSVYVYQGALREFFAPANEPFNPENGENLAQVSALQFQMLSPSLLEVTVTMPAGDTRTLRMALRANPTQEAS